jgi:hypothetical protein
MPGETFAQCPVMPLGVIAGLVDAIAPVIERFACAPKNPVVRREPVVVEERPAVRDGLPVAPADGGVLRGGKRSADEDVIVKRDEMPEQFRHEVMRVGVGCKNDSARGDVTQTFYWSALV